MRFKLFFLLHSAYKWKQVQLLNNDKKKKRTKQKINKKNVQYKHQNEIINARIVYRWLMVFICRYERTYPQIFA